MRIWPNLAESDLFQRSYSARSCTIFDCKLHINPSFGDLHRNFVKFFKNLLHNRHFLFLRSSLLKYVHVWIFHTFWTFLFPTSWDWCRPVGYFSKEYSRTEFELLGNMSRGNNTYSGSGRIARPYHQVFQEPESLHSRQRGQDLHAKGRQGIEDYFISQVCFPR